MNVTVRHLAYALSLGFLAVVFQATQFAIVSPAQWTFRADNERLLAQQLQVQRGRIHDRHGVIINDRVVGPGGVVSRQYNDPSLALVAGYGDPISDPAGLESSYNADLSGATDAGSLSRFLRKMEHRPYVGNDLHTSIDERIQRAVEQIMPNSPSVALVGNPRTGELLAIVSKPHIDPTRIADRAYWRAESQVSADAPFVDRAIMRRYPPGSTFKIVTMAAGLDERLFQPESMFRGAQAAGPLRVPGFVFGADTSNLGECGVAPPLTLVTALVCSDNIVYAHVALALGWDRWLRYAHAFGLDTPTPFDLPVAVSHAHASGPWNEFMLASSGFGQGSVEVTPLQMWTIVSTIANEGRLPRPILVRSVTTPDGAIVKRNEPETLSTSITVSTAHEVRDAMVQVVARSNGSGRLAQVPGVTVAGKTGTAETGDGLAPDAWFVAFAPADNPVISVVVLVEHGGEGGVTAAPLAREIIQATLPYARDDE